jgi:hypothetical protein
MFAGRNITEETSISLTHLSLIMSQAKEQLERGDQSGEQTNVLNIAIDVRQIQIVTQIFGQIGQTAKD